MWHILGYVVLAFVVIAAVAIGAVYAYMRFIDGAVFGQRTERE